MRLMYFFWMGWSGGGGRAGQTKYIMGNYKLANWTKDQSIQYMLLGD